jgi:AcrR family transcriptional regulator
MSKDKTQLLLENEEVFQETINEFSSRSYDLASVNEVIKRSGYNKGSFYYRFKDKKELYISLIDYVFVKQIELYKDSGFTLMTSNHTKDILIALFNNLVSLYHYDERFYLLVKNFYNESDDFISETLSLSVGSLFERFVNKLLKQNDFNNVQMMLMASVYKNLPLQSILKNDISVEHLVVHLLGQHQVNRNQPIESDKVRLIKEKLIHPINYLIADLSTIHLDDDFFEISKTYDHMNQVKKRLKYHSHQLFFNFKRIIAKYRNKPIFTKEALEKLMEDELYNKIVDDPFLYNLLIAYVYGIIDLKTYIVFKMDLHMLDEDQLNIFLNHILPINGSLSKVILLSPTLVFSNNGIKSFYTFNHLDQIISCHYDDFKDKYHLKFHCQYIEDKVYKEVYLSEIESIYDLKDKGIKIIDIHTIHYMDVSDLKKVVDTI